jgi:hypothetical protein
MKRRNFLRALAVAPLAPSVMKVALESAAAATHTKGQHDTLICLLDEMPPIHFTIGRITAIDHKRGVITIENPSPVDLSPGDVLVRA